MVRWLADDIHSKTDHVEQSNEKDEDEIIYQILIEIRQCKMLKIMHQDVHAEFKNLHM